MDKIGRFEKNNPDIAVNVLYTSKERQKSDLTEDKAKKETSAFYEDLISIRDRSKIVNLLLVTHGEKKHFTAVKNMSRLLSKDNTTKWTQNAFLHQLPKRVLES